MRILQLTNKPSWPARDGGAIAMHMLTKGFASLGHEVTLLSMQTLKHPTRNEDLSPEILALADYHFVKVDAGISVKSAIFNLLFTGKPYNAVRFISDDFKRALTDLLNSKRFDVIQLEGLYLCPYIPLIREHSNAVIAYRAHNIESEIWERTARITPGIKGCYLKDLARRLKRFELSWLNRFDLLVAITDRDAQIFKALGNRKPCFVAPVGVEMAMPPDQEVETEFPSVFHLGSLDWAPNQEGLIWFLNHCWPVLLQQFPSLKFYVAGRNAPHWLVEKLQIPGVVYEGEVADAQLYIRSKAVMVIPLLSGSGMRVKMIEGMALGSAVVATTIGAEGIDATPGENFMLADSPNDFTQAISELLGNDDLWNRIRKNAASFVVEKFNNTRVTAGLAAFYQSHLS